MADPPRRVETHQAYQLPQCAPLSADTVRDITRLIQNTLDTFAARFESRLVGFLDALHPVPDVRSALHQTLQTALHDRVVTYAVAPTGPASFRRSLVDDLRGAVAVFATELARAARPVFCTPTGPLLERLCDGVFAAHFPATPDDADALEQMMRDLTSPVNELVEANMRLVASVAKLVRGRGVDLDDLRQEGGLALRRVALTYDPTNGAAFGTFATPAIHRHLTSLTRTARGLTEHMARQVGEYRETEERIAHAIGRAPTPEQMRDGLGYSNVEDGNLRSVLRALAQGRLPDSRDERLENSVAGSGLDPPTEAERRELAVLLNAAIERLPPEEREVIVVRYYQGQPSLSAVAKHLGISEDWVGRRHARALDKIRDELEGSSSSGRTRRERKEKRA